MKKLNIILSLQCKGRLVIYHT